MKNKRIRSVHHPDLKNSILTWLKNARSMNAPVSGPLLCEKALQLAQESQIYDFKASDDWLTKFKKRHNIIFKNVTGESGAVIQQDYANWLQDVLPALLKDFAPDDVFNVDETGLFFRLLPDKTMTFKGDACHGWQKKQRLFDSFGWSQYVWF